MVNQPAAAAAKSLQSCPTLCDPIDGSPPGSLVPGILQARTLEWVAWKWKAKVKSLSRVWLFATPWTTAYQAPPSMGFSRQEYWSGVPSPSPEQYIILLVLIFPSQTPQPCLFIKQTLMCCAMFQVVFQALQTPTHFMFIKTLWGRGCYYSHFIYKQTVGMEVK